MSYKSLMLFIKKKVYEKFTGKLQISFFKGGVSNITVTESFKELPDGGIDIKKELQ